jgi:hypothetical protein
MVQSLLKQWVITKRYDQHHRRHVHDAITCHHPPIPGSEPGAATLRVVLVKPRTTSFRY